MVFSVGRHELAKGRGNSSALMAVLVAPLAVLFAIGASTYPTVSGQAAPEVADGVSSCCLQIVAAPTGFTESGTPAAAVAASRLRTVPRFLSAGVAPERGMQVRTILAARSLSDTFPQIHQMGGVRADALQWHPNGLAVDVMIPNPGTAEGIALGDAIVAFAFRNATRFGLQDAIWRGVYYTPGGRQSSGYGHYDHVHITTTGGGYPSGAEAYLR